MCVCEVKGKRCGWGSCDPTAPRPASHVGGGGGGGGGGGVGRAQRRGRESGARSTDALGGEGARGEGTLSAAIAAARLFHFVGRCAKPYAHTCGWRNIRAGKCAAGLAGAHYEAWPTPNPLTL